MKRTNTEIELDRKVAIEEIANKVLDIQSLVPQKRDSLDFHDLAVWNIEAALEAAYEAGRKSQQ